MSETLPGHEYRHTHIFPGGDYVYRGVGGEAELPETQEFSAGGIQIEVWESPRPALIRQTLVPHRPLERLAYVTRIISATVERRRSTPPRLTFQVPLDEPALPEIKARRVIRTLLAGTFRDIEMWRIDRIARTVSEDGARVVEVECVALYADLGTQRLLMDRLPTGTVFQFGRVGLTPEEVLAFVLRDQAGTDFRVGRVEAQDPLPLMQFNADTGLSALQQLEDATGCVVEYEWDDERRGYLVHLLWAHTPAVWGGVELRHAKNLRALTDEEVSGEIGTRFVGIGDDGLSLADAQWRVVEVAGPAVTLAGMDSERGPAPADGWLLGCRVAHADREPNSHGGLPGWMIVGTEGSEEGASRFVVPGHALQVDDVVQILDEWGGVLPHLDHPEAIVEHGPVIRVVERAISRISNLCRGPAFDRWDDEGALLDWIAYGGATVERTTERELVQWGAGSALIEATAAGQGLMSARPFRFTRTQRDAVLSTLAVLHMLQGKVRLYLKSEATGEIYPRGGTASAEWGTDPSLPAVQSHTVTINDVEAPSGLYRLHVESTNAARWAMDAVTVAAAQAIEGVVLGSGAEELWHETAAVALLEHTPLQRYQVSLVHLYRVDPLRYEHERIRVGDEVRLISEELGVAVATRVVALRERLDTAGEPIGEVELSSDRRDVRDLRRPSTTRRTVIGVPVVPVAPPPVPPLQPAKIEMLEAGAFRGCAYARFRVRRPDGSLVTLAAPQDPRPGFTAAYLDTGREAMVGPTSDTPGPITTYPITQWTAMRIQPADGQLPDDDQGLVLQITVPGVEGEYEGVTLEVGAATRPEPAVSATPYPVGDAGTVSISLGGRVLELDARYARLVIPEPQ